MLGWLLNKTHISWVITAICLGFLGGVATVQWANEQNISSAFLLVGAIVLGMLAILSRLRLLLSVAIVAGVLLGWWRALPALADMTSYDKYIGDDVLVVGKVLDDPSESKTGLAVNLDDITMAVPSGQQISVKGKIWTSLANAEAGDVRRSDQLAIEGVLDNGFGAYVATLSRAKLKQAQAMPGVDPMGELRDDFSDKLNSVMSAEEAGLGMGLLAGQKSVLDEDIQDAFVAASLTHILVASGSNLTILVRFARRLFAKKSRLIALIFSTTLVLLFAGVTGASASMNRAVIVSILSLLLWYVGRKMHPVVLLSTVATATIAVDPTQLWGDVGWYLSFCSFAGVIILAPLVNDLISRRKPDDTNEDPVDESNLTVAAKLARKIGAIPGSLVQVLVETLCAQVVTWPIIAVVMGNVSLVGLLTNILVLPLIPLAMLLTFIAGLGVYILPTGLATIIASPAKWLLDWIIGVAQWGSTLPGASVEFQPELSFALIYFAVVVVVMAVLKLIAKHNFYGDNVVE